MGKRGREKGEEMRWIGVSEVVPGGKRSESLRGGGKRRRCEAGREKKREGGRNRERGGLRERE